MKFDTYTLKARILPTLLNIAPFFTLHYFLLSPTLGKYWDSVIGLEVATDVTFLGAAFFLLLQINRIASKEIFEKRMYDNGLSFPTTNMLLHRDPFYSQQYKKQIHDKIKIDFKINIPTLKEESQNEHKSRQIISEAISHIRRRVGSGILIGQHNSEYGFVRNFTGGTLVTTVMSTLNCIIFTLLFPNNRALMISFVMMVVYLFLTLFSKQMIDSVGRSYAKVLIQEYMST